jgi:hypothetical protein
VLVRISLARLLVLGELLPDSGHHFMEELVDRRFGAWRVVPVATVHIALAKADVMEALVRTETTLAGQVLDGVVAIQLDEHSQT